MKNIALKEKQEKTSTVSWKKKWLELKRDYNMLWEDYRKLVCKIGKLPNAAHIRKQLNNMGSYRKPSNILKICRKQYNHY